MMIYILLVCTAYFVSLASTGDVQGKKSAVIPLTYNNVDFYAEIVVGTAADGEPAQELKCTFDTGSPLLWIAGTPSKEGKAYETIKPFDGLKSSSYKPGQTQLEQQYSGEQTLTGHLSNDNIKIGSSLELTNQEFAEATVAVGLFEKHEALFGLALQTRGELKADPIVWEFSKLLAEPVFGFHLSTLKPGENAGTLILGGADKDYYVGNLEAHDVHKCENEYNGWHLKIDGISLKKRGMKTAENLVMEGTLLANLATGAPLISGPQRVIDFFNEAIYDAVGREYTATAPGTPLPRLPCERKHLYPDVTFTIGGKDYTLEPEDYILQSAVGCASAFHPIEGDNLVLGHEFFNRYYARFDVGKKQVQLAKAKRDTSWQKRAKHHDKL